MKSSGLCVSAVQLGTFDNVRFDLTPAPWPPSPLRGREGKGVGGWGEVQRSQTPDSTPV